MTEKLFLVDGSGFIFRAYHALPPLTRADGTPVGAVYGFCNMLIRLLNQSEGKDAKTRLVVIFDSSRETFRNQIYKDYKANREATPEDLIPQFSLIREACDAFHVPQVELAGFEADDLIASYAKVGKEAGMEIVIVSSDKDLMQLVEDKVSLFDPIKNKSIGRDEVFEKFGVYPDKVIDVQSLAGDSTDNVPGVPGIGIKTAAQLINEYGDLDTLLTRAHEIKQNKRREKLIEHAENARISRQLVTLDKTTPLPKPIDSFVVHKPDPLFLMPFLRQQGFTSMISRLQGPAEKKVTSYETLVNLEEVRAWAQAAIQQGYIAIDTETTSLDARSAQLVGISLALAKGRACYIPLQHKRGEQLNLEDVLGELDCMLKDPAVLKIGQNIKYDMVVLKKYGTKIAPVSDTMLMSYILDGGKHGHGMDELAELHLAYTTIKYTEVTGTGKNKKLFDEVEIDVATQYAAEDTDITLQLYELLHEKILHSGVYSVYARTEQPLISVLVDMEHEGILVDPFILASLRQEFLCRIQKLELEIHQLAGRSFNIGSPKQLGEVLFNELGLPAPKKTKTGSHVTDNDVLEGLSAQGHDIAKKVIEWRGLSKLKSTYIDGLETAINPKTGRVHTSYAMALTSTGRLSSSDPNLQNIPIRTEDGRKIRKAFIAKPGHKLLSLDYSQIELRLLANVAKIDSLITAFRNGFDIHRVTASEVYNVPFDQVDPMLRRQAKAVNFGILYGMSSYGLSQQLGITPKDAEKIINTYFSRFPGIKKYTEDCVAFAKEHGYVQTLLGRRCYTPGIKDPNYMIRQFAERQAINAPLQGGNADIIKRAMIRIPKVLAEHNLHGKMLLQVHDELVFEIPEAEMEASYTVLKKTMETVLCLDVPLIVSGGYGESWGDLK